MTPRFDPKALKDAKAWEYAVRFGFGGAVTVACGLVAKAWGPSVGGVFLAFPAILPASLTLVRQHDGRAMAVDDARGGRLASFGLAWFGLVVATLGDTAGAPATLALALGAWLGWALAAWALVHGRKRGAMEERG